jgi:putative PIN family toxin of toxin-antitoxin system
VKVVLDTNVILAAFATRGLCEAVMAVCLDNHELILSQAILDEVGRHLAGKFKMPAVRVQEVVGFLREHSVLVEPTHVPAKACRDPDDRPILGTAAAGRANCLVTGDADLLSLEQFETIPIITPRSFYDRLL